MSWSRILKEAKEARGRSKTSGFEGVVTNSVEFQRILGLPRRTLDLTYIADGGTLVDVTPMFARPGSTWRFWPVQSAAIVEAALAGGLFAPIKVGGGKTLVCFALPAALDAKHAVILTEPQLKRQMLEEADAVYSKQFDLPFNRITVVAYSELSAQSSAGILGELQPDLIIADEAHNLANRRSARTKRFYRYMREHPTRFCALSGTITNRSLMDYGPMVELALGKNSPVPGRWGELSDWAAALDARPQKPMRPGRLRMFCQGSETAREGYRRRLTDTRGVVAADGPSNVGASLRLVQARFALSLEMDQSLQFFRKNWAIGDLELFSHLEYHRVARQLAMGFYLEPDWDSVGGVNQAWLAARSAWRSEINELLKTRAKPGFDSPGLITKAAERGDYDSEAWRAWLKVRAFEPPATRAVWVDDTSIYKQVFAWIRQFYDQGKRGIVWYEWNELGAHIARHCGLPNYTADHDPRHATEQVITASLSAHGTGKNLQAFSRMLFTTMPSSGKTFEQAVGRMHRPGQQDDLVEVTWFGHTNELASCIETITDDAHYVEGTLGHRQKVLYADRLVENWK